MVVSFFKMLLTRSDSSLSAADIALTFAMDFRNAKVKRYQWLRYRCEYAQLRNGRADRAAISPPLAAWRSSPGKSLI